MKYTRLDGTIARASGDWKALAAECKAADGYSCLWCLRFYGSEKAWHLCAHHLLDVVRYVNGERLEEVVTLCSGCHAELHRYSLASRRMIETDITGRRRDRWRKQGFEPMRRRPGSRRRRHRQIWARSRPRQLSLLENA